MKVLVTNCSRNSGLAAMQSLHAAGWDVAGADDRAPPWGLHARCAAGPYALLPPEDAPGFAAALLALLERARPDVLIPTRGIEAACRLGPALLQHCASLLPDADAFATCNDKARLLELCERLGVPVPRRHAVEEGARLLNRGDRTTLVVKPRRDVGGGEGVSFVRTATELERRHAEVVAAHGGALITDLIEGPTTALYALHLLFDARSRLIASFALRKTRIWPAERGVTVAAESVAAPELVAGVLPIFRELAWRGAADVELKIDVRDGVPRLLEINPRFSGALAFPIGCGVDLPTRYCEAALGRVLPEAPECEYALGRRYVDTSRWLAAVWQERARGGNLRRAATEWGDRVPGAGHGDLPARLAKLALSIPGLARHVSHAR